MALLDAPADGTPEPVLNFDDAAPAPERVLTVGETLRRARNAAGLDLSRLSEQTRVTERHLRALEAGDYAALGGRPYALGFARGYARAVGLDDAAVAQAVRAELDAAQAPPPPRPIHQFEVGDPAKVPTARLSLIAAGLVVALLAAAVVFGRDWLWPAAELPPVTAEPYDSGPPLDSLAAAEAQGLAADAALAPPGAEGSPALQSPAGVAPAAAGARAIPGSSAGASPAAVDSRLSGG